VSATTSTVEDGVKEYQTDLSGLAQMGSSAAVVASWVLTVSVNGRLAMTVALSKSSFGGGAEAATVNTRFPPTN
jgi:hypothetical protein